MATSMATSFDEGDVIHTALGPLVIPEGMGGHYVVSDSLDAAWAEAEAALPKGWWIVSVRRYYFGSSWRVDFGRPDDFDPSRYIENSGPEKSTPAAALRALAAKLREREDGWNVMGFEPR